MERKLLPLQRANSEQNMILQGWLLMHFLEQGEVEKKEIFHF
jgi:hypothetical protein